MMVVFTILLVLEFIGLNNKLGEITTIVDERVVLIILWTIFGILFTYFNYKIIMMFKKSK
jgi:hypothetical protein